MLLIHELPGWPYRFDLKRFHHIMGDALAASHYWWEVRRHDPTWFRDHPHRTAILADPDKWLPAKMFGDDAKVGKCRAILVAHVFSAIGKERRTAFCKLPTIVRNSIDTIKDLTDGPLWDAVVWSWECLARNEFPHTRHDSAELLTGWRKKLAGKNILGDYHVAFVGLTGDWGWTTDVCHLDQS